MPAATNSKLLRKCNVRLVSACMIGIALSYYAYVVETRKEQDDSYEAMCDISENISCTKVFMSEYGKGFGLIPKNYWIIYQPNSIYGLIFYALLAILSTSNNYNYSAIVVVLGIVSNILSVYLAYILYKFNDVCIVCVSTYIVNAAIMFFAIKKIRKLSTSDTREKKRK
ncbi:hypothetical protein DMN91_009537 [Ooceraea biroi]|uniref:vitamin-K-epoxide reductase (warfarin-sensitive) n=1 Tax=Ooceraea biroi TaxID=2015173 RepID=A0A026VZ16_OOCBI|nr:vitamin K epoxide reductase complex subunit 1 [Ooceraea biroi]EZA49048.1 Vitamin K epoxide reductase complex subunit 1-like protein [Ooceraea biroi]RLU17304.1 hypothetical protein DMN91_009537 [Ooceraea biroi]